MNTPKDEQIISSDSVTRKKATARKLIQLYFRQLTEGCGQPNCSNDLCASSGQLQPLSRDEAAGKALRLFVCHAKICKADDELSSVNSPNENSLNLQDVTKNSTNVSTDSSASDIMDLLPSVDEYQNKLVVQSDMEKMDDTPALVYPSAGENPGSEKRLYLTEKCLVSLLQKCQQEGSYTSLSSTLFEVFSNYESLKQSFLKDPNSPSEPLSKEDIRAMEVDQDKDQDSQKPEEENNRVDEVIRPSLRKPNGVSLDLQSLRRAFNVLFALLDLPFQNALINAIILVCQHVEMNLKYTKALQMDPDLINIFLVIMEIPMLQCSEYLEAALPAYCKALAMLPVEVQAKLARVWSTSMDSAKLKSKVDTLHQLITLRTITERFTQDFSVNDEEVISAATKVMKLFYSANILAGEAEPESVLVEEADDSEGMSSFFQGAISGESKDAKQVKLDPLYQELGINVLLCRKPALLYEEFYNEPLSDQIEMARDFSCYKTEGRFSFMNYSFILVPAVKALGLYYDNRISMYSERRLSVLHSFVNGEPPNPYLRLRVRRDHLIDDTLVGLEVVALDNPSSLKKQLVVEFEGEQGIDEGGISKEFFQLIVEELLNPDFAMFTINPETHAYWFNPTSFETDAQFTLIGIILGLAIYNNVILDVCFPMVVYKKLMGKKGTFYDLADWNPTLAKGLQELLSYSDDDIESVFMQTFRISNQDVFGTVLSHDLKPQGDKIFVNHSNKKEFVDLYADFLLNKSIERQFRSFRRGFQMVTDDSPLKVLFRPEEVELLVCGSQSFDFVALEEATDYDGGYTIDSPVIKYFWELVHDFSLEQKRKFLQFATGSDRAPVGGLSRLKLVIARSGPDSDRLPTAHTCFNVLLLPEYSSKEKLQERLLKAINYSKGFGML